jgi:fido (protein-threonine AMPylation protein)
LSQEAIIEGDPYLYADSSILRNLADIHDESGLSKFESDHFFARLLDLHENPIKGSFDSDHLRRIHHFLFQDVYAWAGEFRTVPIAKGNSFFARPEHIGPELQKLFHHLAGERCLRGSDSKEFCQRAAYYLGEINALHPFARETDELNANSFENWLCKPVMRLLGISLRRTKCSPLRWQAFTREAARRLQ